jgi:14-3-3 protein epsilon
MDEKYEKNVYLAMLCEQCHEFDDMKNYLEDLVRNKKDDLNLDESNLISISYKNIISHRRNALKTLQMYEMREAKKESSFYLSWIREYKKRIEIELADICTKLITNIENYLIPRAKEIEIKVFYYKMKADYFRYISENVEITNRKLFSENSLKTYFEAMELAKKLQITNQLRLALALNLSIFFYEIMNDPKAACKITQETLDIASKAFGNTDEEDEEFIDAFRILDTMKENLQIWGNFEPKNE